jgi:CHAT domain-containing protein
MQFTQEKRRAVGEKVLAFGNPDLDDPAMALQFTEIEAGEIKKLYPQSTVLLKKEATEGKAKSLSPQNDIVHFASHAELNESDPLASAILLAKSDKEDGRLEVREIFGMDLKASLVVLSPARQDSANSPAAMNWLGLPVHSSTPEPLLP